ncbi:MAG: NADP-dependent malic enzyme [Bdellovibrionales bacterium]
MTSRIAITDEEALELHSRGRPGKLEITPTKPLTTARDLALAYSPGVAVPCLKIAEDPAAAYDYTARGNLVAVISNGTAVLGLGDLGALASKPVMEGKAVLFKRFADVDSIDIEVDTRDVDAFCNAIKLLGPSFGGINLEDIASPDCFIIEQRLREDMNIPVFHDDQHGTAIIAAAGLINACRLTGRKLQDVKMVVNGAGASAIACVELFKTLGVRHDNVIMCDTKGVIYQGRTESMNQWKSAHAVKTSARTLLDAAKGADMLVGLSAKGAFSPEMIKVMAKKPIVFAMANPDPEITPEIVRAVRPDAIIATGRSDYPNQVNNVLGFPYIFRGALDVRASAINDEMKLAAAKALADLAQQDVPEEVFAAYAGRELKFGPDYIIPVPFDPRLIVEIPVAVAQAAMNSGVAQKPIKDMDEYRKRLRGRLDPTASALELIANRVRSMPQRCIFAEAEEEQTLRAALAYVSAGYGTAILIGRDEVVREKLTALGATESDKLLIQNARLSEKTNDYADQLFRNTQRAGFLKRDAQRFVNNNRNVFGAMLLKHGEADAMVTGLTRNFADCFNDVRFVIGSRGVARVFGLSLIITKGHALFIADTAINSQPSPEQLADICERTAVFARQMGHAPRIALVSYSNFGQSNRTSATKLREALAILDSSPRDFEYEGEMTADLAMDYDLLKKFYPFARLTGPANIMVMPSLHAANIASKLLRKIGAESVISPILLGLEKPVQILPMGANVNDMVTAALLAAYQATLKD